MKRRTRPSYYLRGGQAPRLKYVIYKKNPDNTSKLYPHPRIDALNRLVAEKVVDLARAKQLAQEIVRSLQLAERPDAGTELSPINQDIADRYWAAAYARRKILPDSRRSAKNALQRAVAALGAVPFTDPIERLQGALDKFPASKQRRLATTVNSVLAWMARPERVEMKYKIRATPRHLSHAEFQQLVESIEDADFRMVIEAAFYTGARTGELFALSTVNTEGYAPVTRQLRITGEYSDTKTRMTRSIAINPKGIERVREWAEKVPATRKEELRSKRWADIVSDACQKLWPKDTSKHLSFHDLRHCYAIEALKDGIPIEWVAKSLGNSIVVCEEYYQGFKLSDAMAKAMVDVWAKRQAS